MLTWWWKSRFRLSCMFFFKVVILLWLDILPMMSWIEDCFCRCVSAVWCWLGGGFWVQAQLSLSPARPPWRHSEVCRAFAGPCGTPPGPRSWCVRVPCSAAPRVHRRAVGFCRCLLSVGPLDSSGPFLSLAAPAGSLLLTQMPSPAWCPACPAGSSGPSDVRHRLEPESVEAENVAVGWSENRRPAEWLLSSFFSAFEAVTSRCLSEEED